MIRKELFQVPPIAASNYELVSQLIDVIEEKLERGQAVHPELAQIHTLANKTNQYTANSFRNYWAAISKEELIIEILTPSPPVIEHITREEVLWVLQAMTETALDHSSYYLALLEKNTPYTSALSDLIYWPNELGYSLDLPLEEMARIIVENEEPPKGSTPIIVV